MLRYICSIMPRVPPEVARKYKVEAWTQNYSADSSYTVLFVEYLSCASGLRTNATAKPLVCGEDIVTCALYHCCCDIALFEFEKATCVSHSRYS